MLNEEMQIADEDKKALQDFLLDIDCLDELQKQYDEINIFDVLGISRSETQHSNMLGWLFNPKKNHGLRDLFLKGIIKQLIEKSDKNRYNISSMLLFNSCNFTVHREWKLPNKKRIDILIISDKEKTLIAIENKIDTKEHDNQLNNYREGLEERYSDYNKIYVFLTPDGEDPSDMENWDVLTYTNIVEILENAHKSVELQPTVKFIIENYIDTIRKYILKYEKCNKIYKKHEKALDLIYSVNRDNENKDEKLVEICNKIYEKHRKTLNLIYCINKNEIEKIVCDALSQLNDVGKIIFDRNSKIGKTFYFRTEKMDSYFYNELKNINNNNSMYKYELSFKIDKDPGNKMFYSTLVCMMNNAITEQEKEKCEKIVGMRENVKKEKDVKEKKIMRIYPSENYNEEIYVKCENDEDYTDYVKSEVKRAVDDLLKQEKNLMEKLEANNQ